MRKLEPRDFAAWVILVGYLVIRFAYLEWLDSLAMYASYVFETILVIVCMGLYRERVKEQFRINKQLAILSIAALVLGFLTYRGAEFLNIAVPFNFSGAQILFFLLIVAPVLEEGIFRFLAWQPLSRFSARGAWIATSVLFSFAHYHAIWTVPEDFHAFIHYQTAYTLILGGLCGFSLWRHNSLLGAILIHFGFNLGFYLAS